MGGSHTVQQWNSKTDQKEWFCLLSVVWFPLGGPSLVLHNTRQYLTSAFNSSLQSSMLTLSSRENYVVYVVPKLPSKIDVIWYACLHINMIYRSDYKLQDLKTAWHKKMTKMFLYLEVSVSSYMEKANQVYLLVAVEIFWGYLQLLSLCPALITLLMVTNWPHHECIWVCLCWWCR